jgi:hypothetical protein
MSEHKEIKLLLAEIKKRDALIDEVADPTARIVVGFPYPRLFSELVEHHSFIAFDIGGVRIHSNLRGEEDNLEELLSDKILTEAACNAGFFPFGRPSGGYDRVCFDLRNGGRPMDAPVVVLDHEAILSHNKLPKPRTLVSGLKELCHC